MINPTSNTAVIKIILVLKAFPSQPLIKTQLEQQSKNKRIFRPVWGLFFGEAKQIKKLGAVFANAHLTEARGFIECLGTQIG